MSKNLIRSSKGGSKASQVEEEFMQYVAKNMDGRTFIMLNKYLNELRAEIEKAGKGVPINADFFFGFSRQSPQADTVGAPQQLADF